MRGCATKAVLLIIVAAVIVGLATLAGWQWPREAWRDLTGDPTRRPSEGAGTYVCEVISGPRGVVPKKVVLMVADAALYAGPQESASATPAGNELFATLYVFADRGSFVKVGRSPHDRATLGWLRDADVLRWNTREGFDPVPREGRPLALWESLEGARSGRPYDYLSGLGGSRSHRVLRVLGRDGDFFHVAMVYDQPGQRWHVSEAWTRDIDVGFDVQLVYFVTRAALKDDLEVLQDAWFRLQVGGEADHALIQFMRNDLHLRIGPGADSGNATLHWLQNTAGALNVPIAAYSRQPAEVVRDLKNKQNLIGRLAAFLKDGSNWDRDGGGWLPAELTPLGPPP